MTRSQAQIMRFPKKKRYLPETADMFRYAPRDDIAPWLATAGKAAFDRFAAVGLPSSRLERWKFSNIATILKKYSADPLVYDAVSSDPHVRQGQADAQEAWVRELVDALPPNHEKYGDMALWDLNTASIQDVMVVDIPEDMIVKDPIRLDFAGKDGAFLPARLIIRLGARAQLAVIEHHEGQGAYWRNHVTRIVLGEGARLDHYRIQNDSPAALHLQMTAIDLAARAAYHGFTLTEGASFARHQAEAVLQGAQAHVAFNGINLLKDRQHSDTTLEAEHRAPSCTSSQLLRSVVDDQARGVFQGKVYVDRVAQKTDGYQLSNALLLSEGAEMDTKPELEIYADDVKCSHGATTGQLDSEPLFYLRSRGLSEQEARHLLIEAFVGEVVDQLADESVKTLVTERLARWLKR